VQIWSREALTAAEVAGCLPKQRGGVAPTAAVTWQTHLRSPPHLLDKQTYLTWLLQMRTEISACGQKTFVSVVRFPSPQSRSNYCLQIKTEKQGIFFLKGGNKLEMEMTLIIFSPWIAS
jgi:preprotein translocase subunit SecB